MNYQQIRVLVRLFVVGCLFLAGTRPGRSDDKKSPDPIDPVKLEGKTLHKVNPDDARLLGIIGRGILNQAQKGDKLSPEQTRPAALSAKASQDKDWDKAYRYASRLILLRRGEQLTEGTELATSYDFRLDRKLVAPGDPLTVLLQPLFTLGQPLAEAYTAKLSVKSAKGK